MLELAANAGAFAVFALVIALSVALALSVEIGRARHPERILANVAEPDALPSSMDGATPTQGTAR